MKIIFIKISISYKFNFSIPILELVWYLCNIVKRIVESNTHAISKFNSNGVAKTYSYVAIPTANQTPIRERTGSAAKSIPINITLGNGNLGSRRGNMAACR